ncbi:choice-of-anchor W domain-containing protein [Halorubrum depositum]|uniref:choice-of-anchor W domain-containing protein n=1 Tax=Halorubrum depositum TaxID=2583992 RepID=UPI0011A53FE2|nr:choice-of-anchor W domain-containing protein [Halorubrum depositum]
MNDDTIGLSRRKMLVGLGAVGVASAGAGLGTTAYFNDTESFENNTLTAGELDLFVHVDYSEDQGSYAQYSTPDGTFIDGNVVGGEEDGEPLSIQVSDLKPGDSGEGEFCFSIVDNPAYMWMCGELTANDENGQSEPEMDADETGGDPGEGMGELADAMEVTVSYCTPDGEGGNEIVSGSLADVMNALSAGVPLYGDGNPDAPIANRPAFDGVEEPFVDDVPNVSDQCVCFEWVVPTTVGNEIQTDSVAFDFEFYAEQARHNDGTNNPCIPSVTTRTGEGFAKQQEFETEQETSFARGRYGNNGPSGSWEVAVGPDVGSADTDNYVWTPGNAVPFSYSYDGSGTASFTLDGVNVASAIPAPSGKLAITTKADEATVSVANLALDLDGVPTALSGPDSISATNDGPDREVTYLVFDTDAADVANTFTISGDVTVDVQGDYAGAEEGVAFDISVE